MLGVGTFISPNNQSPSFGVSIPYSTNLLGFWKGNGDALDSYGANNGTLVNGTTFASGLTGQAFSFDGANDRVDLADGLFNYTTFTCSFWFKTSSAFANDGLINNYDDSAIRGNLIWLRNSGQVELLIGNGTDTRILTNVLSLNTWYHIVFTRLAGTRSRVYVNGALDVSNTDSRNATFTGAKTCFGAVFGGGTTYYFNFNSLLQYVRFYTDEKDSTFVSNLYNSGTPI